ncbi:hypothetical protein BY458DRAFT_463715 [Sporodiniella umbellata]|nr:hypothetical protein BY458DRAFT_463715 [Sporodiniella umbellata]
MQLVSATQQYNGGIIFLSYLISVIGAQTTLELLTRRTHIHGTYNWFILAASAFIMGAVAIWSMHFIGNNSMTLWVNDESYQLFYKSGYTFASLVVSIACMFASFTFVGVTEQARLIRIIPSGIFTGLGVVCMHYVGQFAIDYFIIVYKTAYVIGAAVIACVAVTVALFIFFKLRENWMNLWYKRLGCAMLMAIAVCGMHYTALVGTEFYLPSGTTPPPTPKVSTAALIGTICAVTIVSCVGLLYASVKANMANNYRKNKNKRLILDCILFDKAGRVLVKVDGTVPMEEIVHDLNDHDSTKGFSTSHPLFLRLYEATIAQISPQTPRSSNRRSSRISDVSAALFDRIGLQYADAVRNLQRELGFGMPHELGILSDIVVTTDSIAKSTLMQKGTKMLKRSVTKDFHEQSDQLCNENFSEAVSTTDIKEDMALKFKTWPKKEYNDNTEKPERSRRPSSSTIVVSIESLRLSVEDSDGEDAHIFLARQLTEDKDVSKLLSQGYRFSESMFISKTMAEKLRVPAEYMRQCFLDIFQFANSSESLRYELAETKRPVCLGAFVLIQEGNDFSILVNKTERHTVPFTQVVLDGSGALEKIEVEFINSVLQGSTLLEMARLTKTSPTNRLTTALEQASNQLLELGMFSKSLYQSSVLHTAVIDVPAFAVTASPCQLIAFTILVKTPGSENAVNRTFREPFKCIPLPLFRLVSGHLSEQASSVYQRDHQPQHYNIQQQMYRQVETVDPILKQNETTSVAKTEEAGSPSSISNQFSLPPPPRSKRKRLSGTSTAFQTELSVLQMPWTVLPIQSRFLWLEDLVEKIIHNNI